MSPGEDKIQQALDWYARGRKSALVTVTTTWGSSPRPVGSQLVVDEKGAFEGSVSGGCIEAAVITEALEVIHDGKPRHLSFGVSHQTAWDVGLSCGGQIQVLVENTATHLSTFKALAAVRSSLQPVCLLTHLSSGNKYLYPSRPDGGPAKIPSDLEAVLPSMLARVQSRTVKTLEGQYLVQSFCPAPQVVIVGAVHIAQTLAVLARLTGFEVVIVDPRRAFATPKRFPQTTLVTEWPDEAAPIHGLHANSALVVLTHDPKVDDPALMAAFNSKAFYIGALGSRKTQAERKQRLMKKGFSEAQLDRIHGPVGVAIGSKSPAEIALSIMAEIVGVRNGSIQ